jgi:hypothetical protein
MSGEIATPEETIRALLEASKRPTSSLPLRRTFLQIRRRAGQFDPGPLAGFVRAHHDRALDQYLLVHAVASGGGYDAARPAKVWARALSLGGGASSVSAVSKNWAWLEAHRLISRRRKGRLSSITLLKEDGSGAPYVHPGKVRESYFHVPYTFWLEGWDRRLDLAAKAVLLIALSLGDEFILPLEHANGWYGLSSDTLGRGLIRLRREGLLQVRRQRRKAPLAPEGFTLEHRYTLQPPFGPRGRPKAASGD